MLLYTIANLWITALSVTAVAHVAFKWPESVHLLIANSLFVRST
jgi:hypothetical protein